MTTGDGMAGNAADQGRSVTAKLAAILTSFTSGSVQQLTELARHSGLPCPPRTGSRPN
jgi:hypothetical protein